ncbi:hypothetical protein FRB95_005218 [Tulasnella sp. JGI-2019a]|nr:hypothetical protein FRB95_005218 [Tulasnella sp. JGI-2019a]
MSEITILVPIERPTALENANPQSISLPGQDLWLNPVTNVHIIPAKLDLDRFKVAVARTAARYPPVAGRLIREGDTWRIDLVNAPIPVIVASGANLKTSVDPASPTFPFPNDWIIQEQSDVRPYISLPENKFFLRGEGTEPLVIIKLTQWETKTAIGVTWQHTLGDAKTMLDFTLTLSTLYENLDAEEDRLPLAPSFYRHVFPYPFSPPCTSLSEGYLWRMPHLAQDYPAATLMQVYAKGEESTEVVRLRFTAASMERMLKDLGDVDPDDKGLKLNVHNAFSAYLVSVLNHSLEKPARRIVNIVSYRAPPKFLKNDTPFAPFAHPAGLSNSMLAMISDPMPDADLRNPLSIAKHIRRHIKLARDPEFLEKFFTLGGFFMAKSANAGKDGRYHCFQLDEGDLTLNSNYGFNFNDAHFGFPGKTRLHTAWTTTNYFRIFTANPPSGEDVSVAHDADVTFKILSASKGKFLSIVKKDHGDVIMDFEGKADAESQERSRLYH